MARASDTEEPLVIKVSSVTMELSELRTSVCDETDIPGHNEVTYEATYLDITNVFLQIVGGQ